MGIRSSLKNFAMSYARVFVRAGECSCAWYSYFGMEYYSIFKK